LKTLVKRILFVVLIGLAALIFTSVLDELPQFQRVTASYRGEASSVSRVTKGAILYSSLPIKEQLFGVGFGMGERSLSYYYGSDHSFLALSGGYMSAFFVELVNIGLIGALFLNIFYLLLFVRGDNRLIKYGAFMTMRLGGAVTLTSVMCVLWLLLLIIDSEK